MFALFQFRVRPIRELGYAEQETAARVYEIMEQTLSAMPVVQAFSHDEFNDRRFAQTTASTLGATLKLTQVQLRFKVLMGWSPPPDDKTAIRELERLRQEQGAAFMAIAWPSFWWLDFYREFIRHLRTHFRCVLQNERLIVLAPG